MLQYLIELFEHVMNGNVKSAGALAIRLTWLGKGKM